MDSVILKVFHNFSSKQSFTQAYWFVMTATSGAACHTWVGVMRQHSCIELPAVSTCPSWRGGRLCYMDRPDHLQT